MTRACENARCYVPKVCDGFGHCRAVSTNRKAVTFRYMVYAVEHCHTPVRMLAADRETWQGGVMCGFILWIAEQWHAWGVARDFPRDAPKTDAHHADFDQWLADRVLPLGG